MKSLKNKRALVTGAASGIGRSIAIALAEAGTSLLLVDRDTAGLDRLAAELRAATPVNVECVTCDLADLSQVDELAAHGNRSTNRIDILVNNAGVSYYGPLCHMSIEQRETLLSVNFLAPIRLTHRLLPGMLQSGDCHVLNVGSMYSLFPTARGATYHATKYGLVGFTDALRAEYSRFGLGATTLCPGFVDTPLYDNILHPPGGKVKRPPAWSSTTPDKVAQAALIGIRRNRRIETVTFLAWLGYHATRMFPRTTDLVVSLGRRKRYRGSTDIPQATPGPAYACIRHPQRPSRNPICMRSFRSRRGRHPEIR